MVHGNCVTVIMQSVNNSKGALIARVMGPTWGPSGADRTQVGPVLAPWTLLSGGSLELHTQTQLIPGIPHQCNDALNHKQLDCLLKSFRLTTKKTSKLCINVMCAGIHQEQVDSLHKGPAKCKVSSWHDVLMGSNWTTHLLINIDHFFIRGIKNPTSLTFQ